MAAAGARLAAGPRPPGAGVGGAGGGRRGRLAGDRHPPGKRRDDRQQRGGSLPDRARVRRAPGPEDIGKVFRQRFGAPDLAQEAPSELPVYRFDEPSPSELAATVTALTDRSGLSIKVLAGDPAAGQPPRFQVTGLNVPVGPEGQVAAAQSFLGAHALLPTYTYGVISSPDRVVYNRRFGDPAGSIPEVGLDGRAVGLEVDFSGGSLVAVTGPLELAVANSPYPLRVFSTTPAAATGESQGQAVRLVYVLVVAGGHGYYEPELLVFSSAGFEFQPVIAPQYLSRT